jgi:haloacetate dehalogenase
MIAAAASAIAWHWIIPSVSKGLLSSISSRWTVWAHADAKFALAYWPWALLAQPHPLPETILVAAAESIVDSALGGWGSPVGSFPLTVRSAYVEALRDPRHAHAICEEYRAAATIEPRT